MKVGTIIQIHGETGIILKVDGSQWLTLWQDGRKEWVFIKNHINSTLKIVADKKCP